MRIGAETLLYCLLGNPVEHSVSPQIHNELLRHSRINGVYLAFKVPSEKLRDAVEGLKVLGVEGFNVTIPFKEKIMDYLDLLVTPAKISGAVNTVAREKNRLVGYNTDIEGVRHVFHKYDLDLRGSRITIVGAGGAARAAVIAAAGEAVDKITIVNRSVWRAEKLRDDVEAKLSLDIEVCGLGTPKADRAVLKSGILINATPLGMYPRTDETPVEAKLLEGKTAVVDMVYNPLKTRLLQDAESAGAKAIGGLSMLVAQAVHSFRIWTGTEPDETVALDAALKALGG